MQASSVGSLSGAHGDATFFGWSARTQRRGVLLVLAVYVAGFCAFWPNALLISDEQQYVNQALLFSRGEATQEVRDVLHGTVERQPLSLYPVGASALQSIFVRIGGWRWAAVASLLSIAGAVLVSLKWLRDLGRPPIFALLPLVYIGTLVQGRIAMSDAPTALVSTLAFWLFSRGESGRRFAWLGAGLFAGLSFIFRDATPLLFAPLFAIAILRREPRAWQLAAGSVLGASIRFISGKLLFGSALFVRMHGPNGGPLTLSAVPPNIPLYLFLLVVCIPLGLPSLLLHRSRRKLELILGTVITLIIYLLFPLPHEANGLLRDVVLHARYCTAFVPLMIFTLSEWVPRALAGRERLEEVLTAITLAGAITLSLIVHVYLHHWGATLERIADAIYANTPADSVILFNPQAAEKFLYEARGHRSLIARPQTSPEAVARFVSSREPVYAVFVDRTETDFRRQDAQANADFLAALAQSCQLDVLHDQQESTIERVKIAKVSRCRATP